MRNHHYFDCHTLYNQNKKQAYFLLSTPFPGWKKDTGGGIFGAYRSPHQGRTNSERDQTQGSAQNMTPQSEII
jgi:hypothetical protein